MWPRALRLQPLEERNLFAVGLGPDLISIIPNEGAVILPGGPSLHVAPKDLTLRFDDGQVIDPTTLGAIQITRGGPDKILGNSNDVTVTAGFVGIGETPNEVIYRFDKPLPDDIYQVRIVGTGANPLANTRGQAFNNGADLIRTFVLDLGAQVTAVVPQPITRNPSTGRLTQALDTIEVYFNDDNLNPTAAANTSFYQLINTQGTVSNRDDGIAGATAVDRLPINPISVTYDASTDKAILRFNAADLTAPGTYRLRIGNNDAIPLAPVNVAVPSDPADTFTNALSLPNLGTSGQVQQSLLLTSRIDAQPYSLVWPGDGSEPGHRNIPVEAHIGGADTSGGTPRIAYNFRSQYGSDPFGNPLFNVITEAQKQRAREIFALFSQYYGMSFFETPSSGYTIVTGDLRAVDPAIPTGPGGVAGIAGGGLAVMDNAEDWGTSDYGGAWFNVAMHEIGHLIGQGHAYDLPDLNIQGSQTVFGTGDQVYPGDGDVIHGQVLFRPDSKDIDLYTVNLNQSGKLNVETLAQRLTTASNGLDSVITVYDGNFNIIGRNDDYFGSDSFLELQLEAGKYYIGVTSTGNVDFDPRVPDSGMGGRTQGDYNLRLNFTPTPTIGLTDQTNTLLDGDADGIPGGAYNFWFKVASPTNTIFVDKAAPAGGTGPIGSITNPYKNINLALASSSTDQIVRIVGNGGADNNLATLADNQAYEIGRDIFNATLQDGLRMDVPKGVTVMVDAGTVIKLRAANIDAGSQSSGIDRSGGAIQVLGTPVNSVVLTSFHNEAIGTNTDNRTTTPAKGDWGGIVLRDDSDLEQNGIFLNYVNHADISYGGGQVSVNASVDTYAPIHLIRARPNISFNNITFSKDAAISADPNSFEESEFQTSAYTNDYGRVGPDIHGNLVSNNTINGLFVRIRTLSGQSIDVLTVPARFNDTDMVHVISENFLIQGDAGGAIQIGGTIVARPAARLKVDPGMIVKLDGARIETQMGGQVIAEGTTSNRVIFTSIEDDKYGAGGTFDTPGNGTASTTQQPAPGNWGGFYISPTSKANFDYSLITFGGGSTSIEGGFSTFDAVEIQQADVRIANSILEYNAAGGGGSSVPNRGGRPGATASTIFINGAQPVIVNNVIRHNAAAAITSNVSSLNKLLIADSGRTSGKIDLAGKFNTNTGPLINGNRLLNNGTNGLVVRGGVLTAEGIWDDTDIVHVVQSEITIPDFHTFGGLRLQSSPTQSLVVKLSGATAGFTASGRPLDIDDRIGGTLQIVGMPGKPVVLTSLADDTVGAGFDSNGLPQTDTNNDGTASSPTAGAWRSVRFESLSNDRNVAIVNEVEQQFAPGGDLNSIPDNAQDIGNLAPNEKSGDDSVRLGFEVHGALSRTSDVDVYKFLARAGTEVWIDLDRTAVSLDSVVELVDANGSVIARSDNSGTEAVTPGLLVGTALLMQKGDFNGRDFYTTNTRDAGLRVVLPPGPNTLNPYFVRVRSNSGNLTNLAGGQSEGAYQLQIRLRELDEKAGSVVQYADIRFATNGVEVLGKPEHSPLLAESVEVSTANDTLASAQDLGNIMTTDRMAMSVGGVLSGAGDVDWFQFNLRYDQIQRIAGGALTWATMFDIDYADGISRPDTQLAVFDSNGRLIMLGRDSNVADDQPLPASTAADIKADLGSGSFGKFDPTIGTVQMVEATYYVAVFSNGRLPTILDATFRSSATSPLIKLEPVNSTVRIAEDHIGSQGGSTAADPLFTLFPGTTAIELNTAATPYQLGDVVFYVQTNAGILTYNAFTGQHQTVVGGMAVGGGITGYGDMAMRNDGRIFSLTTGNLPANDAVSGLYREFSTEDAALLSSSDDNIVTYHIDPTSNQPTNSDVGIQFNAMTFRQLQGTANRIVYAVGNRGPGPTNGVTFVRNLLYRLDGDTGAVLPTDYLNPNNPRVPTDAVERGALLTAPTLILSDVTDRTPQNGPGDLRDGMTFTIDDGVNSPATTFEFDTGPDLRLLGTATTGVLANDNLFRDGEYFTLNGTNYEFDSGPVMVVPGFAQSAQDGQTFFITDTNSTVRAFEFDSDNLLGNTTAVRVGFANNDSPSTVAAAIVAAVNTSGLVTVASRANGLTSRISFTGDTNIAFPPNPPLPATPGIVVRDGDVGQQLNTIVAAPGGLTEAGTTVTVTTAASHNFAVGARVTIAGAGVAGYNGTFTVTGRTATTFTYTAAVAGLAPSGGGTATLANPVVLIPFEETQSLGVVGPAIATATAPAGGSYARDRVTFSNAAVGTVPAAAFAGLLPPVTGPAANQDPVPIAINNDVNGVPATRGVAGTNVRIAVGAGQVASQLGTAIANAINGVGATLNTTASASGGAVDLLDVVNADTTGSNPVITDQGAGPGGDVTGVAMVNGELYAVSSGGGLYIVNNRDAAGGANLGFIAAMFDPNTGAPIRFSSLSVGPQTVENGRYANTLFATSNTGVLYALTTAGTFDPIFRDGASSVTLGVPVTIPPTAAVVPAGIAFSPIDYNLWHVSDNLSGQAGHGILPVFHNDVGRSPAVTGGDSFYFGLETPNPNNPSIQPGAGNFSTNVDSAGLNQVFDTYNVPGGAYGSLTTAQFSLAGYASGDKPTVYFNYLLQTQNAQSALNNLSLMRDAFRVQISNDGVNWTELATNNSLLSTALVKAELARHISASGGVYRNERPFDRDQHMQELFDDPAGPGGWRQARIDLGDWAGMANLQLRFDFTTSGSFNVGDASGPGSVLGALAGSLLQDGQTFSIDGRVFEFDKGFSVLTPIGGGANINPGDTLTIGDGTLTQTFTFNKSGDNTGNNIAITNADSADDISQKILAKIAGSGLAVTTQLTSNRISLIGATTVTVTGTGLVRQGAPGVAGTNTAVVINSNMTAAEVARAMAVAVDATFTLPTAIDDPTVFTSVKLENSTLRIIGHTVTSRGPLPLSTALTSDTYGNFFSAQRNQNNRFTGAMVDDIIIGFAERGEIVTGYTAPATGADTSFFTPPVDPAPPGTQVLVGPYQLEIRRGTEYGTQNPPNPFAPDAPDIALFTSFNTNDRFAEGYTLIAPAPLGIREGETFVVGDGLNSVTYEFDSNGSVSLGNRAVNYNVATAAQVAANIAAAINAMSGSTKVRASNIPTSDRVDLFNGISVSTALNTTRVSSSPEPDDTLATAFASGLSATSKGILIKTGVIGDTADPDSTAVDPRDVDMIAFQINAGDTITIDVDTSGLNPLSDSLLRIFDSLGNPLATSDDDPAPSETSSLDSYLSFTATATGTYYAAISGFNNITYDPQVKGTGTIGATGNYTVTLIYGNATSMQADQIRQLGDKNLFRDQGYTIIRDTKVSNSAQFGIVVDADARTVGGSLPHPGANQTLTVPTTQNLVPGIAIMSNLIFNNGAGGILFSGDATATPTSAVPFGRIVNNTIYGGNTPGGFGIQVTERAGPTLLNNIIANTTTGVDVDATSAATTILGFNLYQNNGTNRAGVGETFNLDIAASAPLFVNAAQGNFYLLSNSPAIDSGIDSLQERDSLKRVANDVGIPESPIQSPGLDLFGQQREDDATPNSGQGLIPYKDRGALERADLDGPEAALSNPVDNDSAGVDQDGSVHNVLVVGRSLGDFQIQLLDTSGVGVDDTTVTAAMFTIIRNGTPLTLVNDFLFSYDSTNKIVKLTAAPGVWVGGTYVITINNSAAGVRDVAGNSLIPNQPSGLTQFTITLTASLTAPWQNPRNNLDVNDDGFVSPIDALLVIEALNTLPGGILPSPATPPPFVDVNGDNIVSGIDMLLVIAQLNTPTSPLMAQQLVASSASTDSLAAEVPQTTDTSSVAVAASLASSNTPATTSAASSSVAPNAVAATAASALSPAAVSTAFADDDFDLYDMDDSQPVTANAASDFDWNFEDVLEG